MKKNHVDGPCRNFSRGLAVLRRAAGLNQKDLSSKVWGTASMNQSRISNIEVSRHGLSLHTAYAIAQALNTTIDAVIAAGARP